MSEKKILYIDMDGTVADLQGRLLHYHPEMPEGYSEEANKKFYEICYANRNIFHELEPISGSDEAVEELKSLFDIYFLSVPMWDLPESFTDKRLWVEKHYGEWGRNRLILSAHKHLNNGEFLVDDTTRHGVDRFAGEHIHIFTEKWPDWPTVTEYLKSKAYTPINKEKRRKRAEKYLPNI